MKINGNLQPQQNVGKSAERTESSQVGREIRGKVISVDGSKITIDSKGEQLTLKNVSDAQFVNGMNARFIVVSEEEGTLSVKPHFEDPTPASFTSDRAMVALLGTQGATILDALKALNLPVTQATFDLIRNMQVELQALIKTMGSFPEESQAFLETQSLESSLKSMALSIGKALVNTSEALPETMTGSDQTKDNASVLTLAKAIVQTQVSALGDYLAQNGFSKAQIQTIMQNPTLLLQSTETSQGDAQMDKSMSALQDKVQSLLSQQNLPESVEKLLNTLNKSPESVKPDVPQLVSGLFEQTQEASKSNQTGQQSAPTLRQAEMSQALQTDQSKTTEKAELAMAVRMVLQQVSTEDSALFLKNQVAFNLKNILINSIQSSGVKSITDGFSQISKLISEMPEVVRQEALKIIASEDSNTLDRLQALIQNADVAKDVKVKVSSEIAFVKDASQISTQFGDQIMVMHMPLVLNKRQEEVSLYMKRKNGVIDQEQMTILISLDTHNVGEVRCIVEKRGNQYGLHFKLENDAIKEAFENESDTIKKQIEALGIQNLNVTFSNISSPYPGIEIDPPIVSGFDLSV